jgi:hypothetical protein
MSNVKELHEKSPCSTGPKMEKSLCRTDSYQDKVQSTETELNSLFKFVHYSLVSY